MRRTVLLDTGPLVAFVDRDQRHHAWAKEQWSLLPAPLFSCEAVLSEALFLERHDRRGQRAILDLVQRGLLRVPFRVEEEAAAVAHLMERYASVPISFADACLVRMSEQHSVSLVLTLDSDFGIYRRHGRQVVPTIAPAHLLEESGRAARL